MHKQRLIAVHLLNDYSGSPQVLKQALQTLTPRFDVHLYTATPGSSGILSNIPGVTNDDVFYRHSKNKWLTLFFFLYAQLNLFVKLLWVLKRSDEVYINTLLPFGAALAAKCKGCRIVYHVHEVSLKPRLLKSLLVKTADWCADEFVFVSKFVQSHYNFRKEGVVVYNSLPQDFIHHATTHHPQLRFPFTVLMLSSLKAYKGVYEFVELSRLLPKMKFNLVLNANENDVKAFRLSTNPPNNCHVFSVQKNTLPFYKEAHVVLNLSHPDQWTETFGLTILEGMYFGLPAIVPSAGGPLELVTNAKEGFHVSPKNVNEVYRGLTALSGNLQMYLQMSAAAKMKAAFFSPSNFEDGIKNIFQPQTHTVQNSENGFRQMEQSIPVIS